MDRHATDSLAQFCIDQRNAFDAHAWDARLAIDGAALILAAKYLSMTSWYGYEEELERIAARAAGFVQSSSGLHRESRAADFDLPYFSAKVRLGLAMARPHVPRPERRHPYAVPPSVEPELLDAIRRPPD